ncbi:tRNA pseudouridine(55) synthase TruB [Streptomyces sp. AJS327]|uniref:tRNA pseudouridine(55) synthase TruB n=1 Tax=Streptomyces sp. AJS327 TaxID=2545265 RepID=UPI0015DEDD0B|nr:tRNA pseudouridine(55) synthase TruB [Streptomyces sp. AJS327]MBA0051872.1 tRNA pseudouridine(55) synthase TruB [Streptomyces sp. AJS327]
MARKKDTDPGGLVIVDKPAGFTSHDVVAKARGLARTRRVGHAGTLDPMATGVLVLGVGKATRLLGYLALTEKEYVATVRLGESTVTDDAEGERTAAPGAAGLSRAAVEAAVAGLTGEILQVPSAVSAVKVDGKRAYKRVREGEDVQLAPRPVTVSSFAVHDLREARAEDGTPVTDVLVSVVCSSGTYVRALARDLGAALGGAGHLTALRRTRVGPYGLGEARTLEELQREVDEARQAAAEEGAEASRPLTLLPLDEAAASAFPRWTVDAEGARLLGNGARLRMPGSVSGQAGGAPVAVFGPERGLIALVEEHEGRSKSLAVFV